jgi:hypothetical protein
MNYDKIGRNGCVGLDRLCWWDTSSTSKPARLESRLALLTIMGLNGIVGKYKQEININGRNTRCSLFNYNKKWFGRRHVYIIAVIIGNLARDVFVNTGIAQKLVQPRISHHSARVKAHTDRTRFGNATRIFNFQWHLTSIFFYVFQIFGTAWAILAIWCAYLVKFLSVDGFICF